MEQTGKIVTVVAVALLSFESGVYAQMAVGAPAGVAGSLISYEVISVKENKGASGNMMWNSPSGGVKMENVDMRMLIAAAFSLRAPTQEQITGLPRWAEDEHFDLEAKIGSDDLEAFKKLKDEDRATLLVKALEDRVKLKARVEMREMPIYSLVVAKGGSKLRPSPDGSGNMSWNSDGKVNTAEYSGVKMEWVAANLSNSVDRQVRDDTGLTGKYAMKLAWAPADAKDTSQPGIFMALQDQWGLKLVPSKGPVKCVVVDHVDQPSDN